MSAIARLATASTWKMPLRPIINSIPTSDPPPRRRRQRLQSAQFSGHPCFAGPYPPAPKCGNTKRQGHAVGFGITNGWNDFQGNMAAAAGLCGTCYGKCRRRSSGHSRHQRSPSEPCSSSDAQKTKTVAWQSRSSATLLSNRHVSAHELRRQSLHSGDDVIQHRERFGFCPGVGTDVLPIPNPYAPK